MVLSQTNKKNVSNDIIEIENVEWANEIAIAESEFPVSFRYNIVDNTLNGGEVITFDVIIDWKVRSPINLIKRKKDTGIAVVAYRGAEKSFAETFFDSCNSVSL